MASRSVKVEPFDLVVFGAAGDLACRKLHPALLRRETSDRFSEPTRVIGVSRRPFDREQLNELMDLGQKGIEGLVEMQKQALGITKL